MKTALSLIAGWLLALFPGASVAVEPDLILHHGRIATVDDAFSIREALAVQDGRIQQTGTNDEILALRGPHTEIIDLAGRMVLPGLIDSHVHPDAACMTEFDHPIPDMQSIADVLDHVKARAQTVKEGAWIVLSQVFITRLREQRYPTRAELDAAAPRNPVLFRTGPDASLNTLALKLSGIDRDFKVTDGGGGFAEKDPTTGEPTGILRNCTGSVKVVESSKTASDPDHLARLKELFADYNSVGITSICDRDASLDAIERYRTLREQGALTVRVSCSQGIASTGEVAKIQAQIQSVARNPLHTERDDWLRIIGIKMYLDGGMLTGSAYMRQPWGVSAIYSITDPQYRGVLFIPHDRLLPLVRTTIESGLAFTAHSVGDGAVHELLGVYDELDKAGLPVRATRSSITHANFMSAEAVAQAARLGVMLDVQPVWLYLDAHTLMKQFGDDRLRWFQPLHSLFDVGVNVGGGSDHMQKIGSLRSVNPYNPFLGIATAVTRRTRDLDAPLHPEEALTREQALRFYTINNARLLHCDNRRGSLEPGKLADFAILDTDLLACPPEQIAKAQVLFTYIGGKLVFDRNTTLGDEPVTGLWWDDFPVLVQTTDAAQAQRVHASAALCGAANDPAWGLFAQRLGIASMKSVVEKLRAAGVHPMSWFEGFGTTQTYVAQLKRDADGAWLRDADGVARVLTTHWSWKEYDGSGEMRWLGTPDYFDDADYARPFTRMHPRYGAPAATYPDGRAATGYTAPGEDPRTRRFYDATCAQDLLGRVTFDLEYNADINRISHDTGQPAGPITGLLSQDTPLNSPQPGFTKEEWVRLKPQRFASSFHAAKDSACPLWPDYARASMRQALDAGMDGLWVDNWSAWDSWNAEPLLFAFGDWSEAGFRDYLRKLPADTLRSWGVGESAQFNIRQALQARCKEWGGDPANLYDAHWRDSRWRDEPLWRAYMIYKRQAGTAALSRYYHVLKEEAAKAGRPDFLVAGNDIPIFSLGWARGDVDMASTELSYGWGLMSGPRGLMPPPLGGYVPIYNLGREHTRSRFMNVWMYVTPEEKGRANLARVLYYQALANHASPMPHYEGSAVTAGNESVDAEFFAFVRSVAPVFGKRQPLRDVGVYYSSSSQLMEFVPAGVRDHANQPHAFAFLGWGTALTQLHMPWRAVPEWKLNADTLGDLRVLIVPSAEVFPEEDIAALIAWTQSGGTLIIAGDCGRRLGESGNFDIAPHAATLGALFGMEHIVQLGKDPGLVFYRASNQRPSLLPALAKTLAEACSEPPLIAAPDISWKVGLTPYRTGNRLFVDINNTDLDLTTDTLTPIAPLHFTLRLPPDLRDAKWQVRVLAPGDPPAAEVRVTNDGRLEISLEPVSVFASVVLDKE